MKNLILLAGLLTGSVSQACLGEAQIIAVVSSTAKTGNSCIAYLAPNEISFYAENQTCPLDQGEMLYKGINVGFKDGHDCLFEAGDELTGIVVKNPAGDLYLE